MLKITNEQAAYLAGLIDGEGYVGARVAKDGYVQAGLVVINTNRSVLDWACSITGIGVVKPKKKVPNRKQVWRWIVGPQPASELLRRVRGYSQIKRMEMHLFGILAALTRIPVKQRRELGFSYDLNRDLAQRICALKH